VTTVRIVPRPGWGPGGSVRSEILIVLADDTGHRALPLWLRVSDPKSLWHLLDRPADDAVMTGGLEETAVRLLEAAGVRVTGVDFEPASEDVRELSSDTVSARVGLATAAGAGTVLVTAGYGLALAAVAGAPVRVAGEVMDRLAVPVPAGDVLAPFRPPAAPRAPGRPPLRQRFEPRNMAFTDGLDRWELTGGFLAAGQPHWQDYACAAADGSAVLASAVSEPAGFAVLAQTIYADDYRGGAVTFRGQLRTTGVAGHAGLLLAAGPPDGPPGADLRDLGSSSSLTGPGSSLTGPGSGEWTWREVTTDVAVNAGIIRFGISLTGRGRIELRNAELAPARLETRQ
jgi:hypothetical protein